MGFPDKLAAAELLQMGRQNANICLSKNTVIIKIRYGTERLQNDIVSFYALGGGRGLWLHSNAWNANCAYKGAGWIRLFMELTKHPAILVLRFA